MGASEIDRDSDSLKCPTFRNELCLQHKLVPSGNTRLVQRTLKACLRAWRHLSIGRAQQLRRAHRFVLGLRVRSLLRAWKKTSQDIRKLLQHQEHQKECYVRLRMLHIRSACLFRVRMFRWTVEVAQVVLSEWRLASRISRFIIKKHKVSLLLQVFRSFLWIVRTKKEWRHYCKSKANRLIAHRLCRSFGHWKDQLLALKKTRSRQQTLLCRRRVFGLQRTLSFFKSLQTFHLRERAIMQKFAQHQAQQALLFLKLNVRRRQTQRAALCGYKRYLSRETLRAWSLLYRIHKKFAGLESQPSVQRCLQFLLYDCALTDILRQWHFAAKFQIKKAHAAETWLRALRRLAHSMLQRWRMGASNAQLERNTKFGIASSFLQITRLRHTWSIWKAQLVKAKRLKSHQVKELLRVGKRALQVWWKQISVFQYLRKSHSRSCFQLNTGAFCLWRAAVSINFFDKQSQRRVLSSWAEWAALRRQVRDEVAWQRWADGVADLFITRRLLLGLPSCFTAWCQLHRSRKVQSGQASAKQVQVQRRIEQLGFLAFRRSLALAKFCKADALLRRVKLRHILDILLHFRHACHICSQCETVAILQQRRSRLRVS